MKRFLFFLFLTTIFIGCSNSEIGDSDDVKAENIFYDYKIWGEEGNNTVTCLLQYRFGGKNGTTLILKEPSSVALDGVKIKGDSARLTGAYYEVLKPLDSFAGKHSLVFTDPDKNQHQENFEFIPFELFQEIPSNMEKKPFVVKLKNFPATETPLRLVMTDTAFSSNDVNDIVRVKNGQVEITQSILDQLSYGPVSFELYKEEERPIKNASKEGGIISITYGLKRQITLEK